jgi:plastocyanin
MKRRDFLKVASGTAGGAAVGTTAVSPALAQEEGDGGGGTVTVELVDYAYNPGTEEPLYIAPGTTVNFVWKTDSHNINVDSQPDGANWEGHMPIENTGFEYEHTFETMGTYEFHCDPHLSLGMEGTIIVNESGAPPAQEGPVEMEPHEMGVAFQAHYVGIATILSIFVTLVYTFFVLKYGESRNASAPNKR